MRGHILFVFLVAMVLAESVTASRAASEAKGLLTQLRALIESRINKDTYKDLQKREEYGVSTCEASDNQWWNWWFKGYTSGTIQTYNYGNTENSWYAHNSQCEWKICVPEGKVVRLTFQDAFWIEGEPGECYDKLTISDGEEKNSTTLAVICGEQSQQPLPVTSSGNCMNAYFTSDGSVHGSGFRAKFEAVQPSSKLNPNPGPSGGATRPSTEINPTGCGRRQLMKRIMNGYLSKVGQWPWIVQMKLYTGDARDYYLQCGANIINNWWVLTAAHCVENEGYAVTDPKVLDLNFGEYRTNEYEESQFQVAASKIIIHPKRNSMTSFKNKMAGPYDIALVKLETPLTFNDYVSPVCLPTRSGMFPVGTLCYASGWGKQDHEEGLSTKLYHLDMEIMPLSTCRQYFGTNTNEDQVCANSATRTSAGACQGDSGGPLACSKDGVYTLAGLTSIVIYCGTSTQTTPTEFASTEYYMDWITDTIRNN